MTGGADVTLSFFALNASYKIATNCSYGDAGKI